jgi:DNA-binding transcriptional LysR family regulator
MELRHLRYFAAVAKHLNFTRAAEDLHVAQPALSRQIRQLEDEMGVRLFERNQRTVTLTQAGRAFLQEAHKVLRQSEEAVRVARSSEQNAAVHLNLGYIWGLFHTITPAALSGLRQKCPNVSVNLFDMNAHEQRAALVSGTLDAGFIGFEKDAEDEHLARRRIAKCEFMLVLPSDHALAHRDVISLSKLSHEFFISVSEATYPSTARCASDICEEAGFRPRILQAAERGYTILALVAARCGVALLPASLAAMPHTGVVFRSIVPSPSRDLYVAWHKEKASPLLESLLTELASPKP